MNLYQSETKRLKFEAWTPLCKLHIKIYASNSWGSENLRDIILKVRSFMQCSCNWNYSITKTKVQNGNKLTAKLGRERVRELPWQTQQKQCGYGCDSLQASDEKPTTYIYIFKKKKNLIVEQKHKNTQWYSKTKCLPLRKSFQRSLSTQLD